MAAGVVRLENKMDATALLDVGVCIPPRGTMLVPTSLWETLQRTAHFLLESGDVARLEGD